MSEFWAKLATQAQSYSNQDDNFGHVDNNMYIIRYHLTCFQMIMTLSIFVFATFSFNVNKLTSAPRHVSRHTHGTSSDHLRVNISQRLLHIKCNFLLYTITQ